MREGDLPLGGAGRVSILLVQPFNLLYVFQRVFEFETEMPPRWKSIDGRVWLRVVEVDNRRLDTATPRNAHSRPSGTGWALILSDPVPVDKHVPST